MRCKRGFVKEVIEIILAAAGMVVILLLLYNLIYPYDKVNESANSYFDSLKKELSDVDSGGTGEFLIWNVSREDSIKYYVVYFGDKSRFKSGDLEFIFLGSKENNLCICYLEGEMRCKSCESLDFPAKFEDYFDEWFFEEGVHVKITKKDGFYEFKKI